MCDKYQDWDECISESYFWFANTLCFLDTIACHDSWNPFDSVLRLEGGIISANTLAKLPKFPYHLNFDLILEEHNLCLLVNAAKLVLLWCLLVQATNNISRI